MSPAGADPHESLTRQIAHRLIESRRAEEAGGNTAAQDAAAACDHLYSELSRWLGPDGCHALFTRARAEALPEHPTLAQLQLRTRSEPYVDGVAGTVAAYGDDATAEAIEAMLVHLIELLTRLIGNDMAATLVERSLRTEHRSAEFDGRREEA